jgi:hypothetical protein
MFQVPILVGSRIFSNVPLRVLFWTGCEAIAAKRGSAPRV